MLINDKLERLWEKMHIGYFNVQSQYFPAKTEEDSEELQFETRYHNQRNAKFGRS